MAKHKNADLETSGPQDNQENNQFVPESTPSTLASKVAAGLYIVATPIGNAQDITLRALSLLKQADTILCEDTRVTAKLLMIHGISKKKCHAYHEHNAEKMRPKVLDKLNSGEVVVLVSDAGTPLINDPGYKLVRECNELGLPYTTAPGASSVITAMVLSGLPSDRFLYLGFLPNKTVARKKALEEVKSVRATLITLESPRRVAACLKDMADVLGNREAAVTRELTKRYEEVRRAPLPELAELYQNEVVRGEVVLVVGPPDESVNETSAEDLDSLLENALARLSVRDAVAEVVDATGLKKRAVYNRALELTKES
ncbi:putative methyltransferase [Candidatus Terasakiella magnetica]|uniref:Ribosomal RNA small subunit methyltransferase I n=1 Tax=Candidatus Terasakiella magnetica TaxID=1867952 RepID=A0A1C3RGL8_9PROT|nr:16S rRNA (cytidine(1402)-2'-O)-methyltransferase [Candidatus Terasakiella magnetica]SCA56433.1 putative methyltransferase [Candidatus Terasakiella magnetica]